MSHSMPLYAVIKCPACSRELRVHKDFTLVLDFTFNTALTCDHNYEKAGARVAPNGQPEPV